MGVIPGMALKRPCKDCPFRTDVDRYLTPARYMEIGTHLAVRGENFSCHKTLEYGPDDEVDKAGARTCAGAMIWLQHQGKPNQMMQVMHRLGAFDPTRLDMKAPVWKTFGGFVNGVEDAQG